MVVIGVGNPDRGDDGVGALVARELERRLPPDVVVKTRSGNLLGLIDDWDGFDAIVCIDAAAPAGNDGCIRRFDLSSSELPSNLPARARATTGDCPRQSRSAGRCGVAPREIVVYAIEGARSMPAARR